MSYHCPHGYENADFCKACSSEAELNNVMERFAHQMAKKDAIITAAVDALKEIDNSVNSGDPYQADHVGHVTIEALAKIKKMQEAA